MKKFIKFTKKHLKTILIAIALIVAVFVGFEVLHNIATAQRGYDATGGEIFVFLVPYLIYSIVENVKDTKKAYKDR